jgi:hypothetical protein
MNSIYDLNEAPLTREELEAARQKARLVLQLWKRRAAYSTVAFILSCASVTPFLYGFPLHAHWDSFGKYLVLLSMGLLLPFVVCVGIAISSWIHVREMEKSDA